MLEFTGLDTVLRALGVLYWVLAAGLLALALWKPETRRRNGGHGRRPEDQVQRAQQ
ncbi:MAG: hypothetical protein IT529_00525 [Burkholderiales bacterium]|nr:hypothetical protein [Burkholderiales bacterium]